MQNLVGFFEQIILNALLGITKIAGARSTAAAAQYAET